MKEKDENDENDEKGIGVGIGDVEIDSEEDYSEDKDKDKDKSNDEGINEEDYESSDESIVNMTDLEIEMIQMNKLSSNTAFNTMMNKEVNSSASNAEGDNINKSFRISPLTLTTHPSYKKNFISPHRRCSSLPVFSDDAVKHMKQQAMDNHRRSVNFSRNNTNISLSKDSDDDGTRASWLQDLRPIPRAYSYADRNEEYPIIQLNDPVANSQSKLFPSNFSHTTKYQPWITFLPRNLFEQFRRTTNMYFLLVIIITLIPRISPITPVTAIIPLVFVLSLAALKEAVEDYRRYSADKEFNFAVYSTIKECRPVNTYSKDIHVGDLVLVNRGEQIPADMIVLKTSMEDGSCYVETSQLDGESSLKTFIAVPFTRNMAIEEIASLKGTVTVQKPDHHLYSFRGSLRIDEKKISVNEAQLLLRGTTLRNVDFALGIACYCGADTKFTLNQSLPPSKFSRLDSTINRFVIGIFCSKLVCCLIASIYALAFESTNRWYLPQEEQVFLNSFKLFFSYFALLSFLIPMSLMVTMEVVRVAQAKFMEWDKAMMISANDPKDPMKMVGMTAKTSNLHDELALARFLFCDKTGTLTENKMVFCSCSIGGELFENPLDKEVSKRLLVEKDEKMKENIYNFLLTMAVCHTVIVENDSNNGESIFTSVSPDETALCCAASRNEFDFLEKTEKAVHLNILGQRVLFNYLCTFEFSSERSCMSILLRSVEGKVFLFTKGADTVLFNKMKESPEKQNIREKLEKDLHHFSTQGYRTLVLAYKEVNEDEFHRWWEKYDEAINLIEDRDYTVGELYKQLETDLHILGCTAVEDRLQEHVPETIAFFLKAGVRVWIITGDCRETAINIGYSCKLLKASSTVVKLSILHRDDIEMKLQKALNRIMQNEDSSLVVDGESLRYIFRHHSLGDFVKLATKASSVICCRVTPLQKARVVQMVRANTGPNEVCIAVGDGANDVSMLQAAHIGVGLYGQEGTQAARSSDYAIRQFSHLKRLVFVHGRYSLLRNSKLIGYSFYKNFSYFLVPFWYGFYSGQSGKTFYSDWSITLFNIFLSSFPTFAIAFFEKDVNEATIERNPKIFKEVGDFFNYKVLTLWLLEAVAHSLIFFFAYLLLFNGNDVTTSTGRTSGDWEGSVYVAGFALLTITGKMALITNYWTIGNALSMSCNIIVYICLLFFESFVRFEIFSMESVLLDIMDVIIQSPSYYFSLLLLPVIILLPDFVYMYIQRTYFPWRYQILQEKEVLENWKEKSFVLQDPSE